MPGPTPSEKRKLFEGHLLFGNLPPADLDALLTHARVEHYRAGQEIFAKGSPGRSMMAIVRGSVRISTPSAAGREFVLTIMAAGEVFGEIALFDGHDRTADATAISDCDLLVLDHRDFIPFLERRGDLCILLLKLLCERLRQTDLFVEDAVFERLDTRVAKALMRLAAASQKDASGKPVSLRVSQQELAGMVGATRESVNKQLQLWQRAGLLRLGKRLIVIDDASALKTVA